MPQSVNKKLSLPAASQGESSSHVAKFKTYANPDLVLIPHSKYQLTVCSIETVFEFYVQISASGPDETADPLTQLMSDMQTFYGRKINLPQPVFEAQNACVYFDYEKKKWYRAQIQSIIDQDHCTVALVDYGLKQYVNRACLRDIPDKFTQLCGQAALACLNDLADENPEYVDEQLHTRFKELALNNSFYAKCMGITGTNTAKSKYLLNLFDDFGESVYSSLADNVNYSILAPADKFKPKVISSLDDTQIGDTAAKKAAPAVLGNA